MKKKEIKFIISIDGTLKLDVLNMKGESCKEATAQIERALLEAGSVRTAAEDKPEIFEMEESLTDNVSIW